MGIQFTANYTKYILIRAWCLVVSEDGGFTVIFTKLKINDTNINRNLTEIVLVSYTG